MATDDAATLEAAAHPLGRGRIGPFRLTGLLGEGGMAVVFRGEDDRGAPAAVKVIRATLVGEHARTRFAREARIRVSHPNVIRVLDAGTDGDGTPYIAFELLEGASLQQRLASADRPSIHEVIDLGVQVCRGLEAVHAAGVIHRDLKPANLFCAEGGTIKVLDFGVAHLASSETQLTVSGHVVGTPAYLSPEQARGEPSTDPRIDVWAVGAVLYEALVGEPPFERETALATMLATLVEPVAPPSHRAIVPPDLDRVICRALEKDKTRRWPSARALREALEAIDAAQTAERVAPESVRPSLIAAGEQRVVVVLLAEGVVDRGALAEAVRDRGGELLPLAGERAVGLFGHRRWEGGEALRACEAATHARSAALRIGVASGRATQTGAYVAGDALRDAERGCAASLRGVAVSQAIVLQLADAARVRAAGDGVFELRGLPETRVTRASLSPPPSQPLLGREAELSMLRLAAGAALDAAQATSVLITGPPGIGKTRLALEIDVWRSEAVAVLRGRGEPHKIDASFSLIATLLESVLEPSERRDADSLFASLARFASEETAREHAPYLAELLGVPVEDSPALRDARRDAQLMRDRIRLAFAEVCEAAAQRGLAMLLEDLQWADAPSLELVGELLVRLEDAPLLVVATARPEVHDRIGSLFDAGHLVQLRLRGLAVEHVAALAERVAERAVSASLLRDIAARTAGNPLFVEQIVLALIEEQALTARGSELPLPLSVEAAVQSRLDHLPGDEKELCKRVSILDPPFGTSDLAALALPRAHALLPALTRRGLMERIDRKTSSEPELRFKSDLVRDVAGRMLTDVLRRELHASVAADLRARQHPDAERIARHFDAAGETRAAAVAYAEATEQASRRCDTASVLRCSERAIALGMEQDELFDLHVARAEALRFAGDREQQGRELELALARARDATERARVRVEQIAWLQRTGRQTDALDAGTGALEEARRAGDPQTIVMALARLAAARLYAGDHAGADGLLCEAEERVAEVGPKAAAYVAAISAELASARGELGRRRDAWTRAAARLLEAGDVRLAASVESNIADLYNRVGMYEEAAAALREAIERGRRLNYPLLEGYASVNLGYSLLRLGRYDDAAAALSAGERIGKSAQDARLELFACFYAAKVRLAEGADPEEVERAARALAERARERQLPSFEASVRALAGRAALRAGELLPACEHAERAMQIRDELGGLEEDEADVFLLAAEVRGAIGDAAGEAELLRRGAARLRELASGIREEEWRERFLSVEAHRALIERAG